MTVKTIELNHILRSLLSSALEVPEQNSYEDNTYMNVYPNEGKISGHNNYILPQGNDVLDSEHELRLVKYQYFILI